MTFTNQCPSSWHYEPYDKMPAYPIGKEFMKLCQAHLPRNDDLPLTINSTGYIDATGLLPYPRRYWTLDPVGRMVIVIDNFFFFQRYQTGELVNYGEIKDDVPEIYHGGTEDRDLVISRSSLRIAGQ